MNTIKIRKATLKDLPILRQFEQGVIEAERPYDVTLKTEKTFYYDIELLINSPNSELLIATYKNEIIATGYARIENAKPYLKHNQHAYLGFMYVHPDFRGRGINKLILEELKKWIKLQSVTELRLEVYVENHGAIKAYKKAGFSNHMIEVV